MKNLTLIIGYAIWLLLMLSNSSVTHSATTESELIIHTKSVNIGGTLALPYNRSSDSLIIMLSGSGPQDRDETLDGFKVFHKISRHLSKAGIPSFRFDDRGVGDSTGNFGQSTLEEQVQDVNSIIQYFLSHQKFEFKKFILLGHSQGGIVATRVATQREDVVKVILMGAPSVPLIDLVLYQVRDEYQGKQIDRALVEQDVSAHNRLMWAISKNQPIDQARKEFRNATFNVLSALPENINTSHGELVSKATAKADELSIVYALPSLTSFLYHDTAKDYADLNIPVLALFGGKDYQVSIEPNKDVMEKALLNSKSRFRFITYNDANHYFQAAKTGKREEYRALEHEFVAGFLDDISNWIKS